MDQRKTGTATAVYTTILGRNPENHFPYQEKVVVSLSLPRMGEHDMKFVVAEQLGNMKYFHYGFRIHPKATPINVHVFGERELIEYLAQTGKPVKCELELVAKKVSDREFILVNLFLTKPWLRETHVFKILGTSPDPMKRPWFVYTTNDMRGVGISVEPT